MVAPVAIGATPSPCRRNRHSAVSAIPQADFPSWPVYAPEEIAAVERVLRSGRVNYWGGEEGRSFEQEFARQMQTGYGVALANGSVALELAIRALGIGPGDEVIVTPRSFIASASSVPLCGATPVFADVERDSQNLSAETIRPRITPRTRAILVVHLAGWPCDMAPILELAAEQGLRVIEDCAQAHGARIDGRPVGSFGDLAAFSFCQDKIISTGGEGGMLLTSSETLWQKAWAFKDHGRRYPSPEQRGLAPGSFRWVHDSFGSNLRMTEMQAAIGRVQLRRLEEWVQRRRDNAAILARRLADIPALSIPQPPSGVDHAYYKFYVFLDPSRLRPGWSRGRIIGEINERGVPCSTGSYGEIYTEQAFRQAGFGPPEEHLPTAAMLAASSLMFSVHPTLEPAHMQRMADIIHQTMSAAMD